MSFSHRHFASNPEKKSKLEYVPLLPGQGPLFLQIGSPFDPLLKFSRGPIYFIALTEQTWQ